MDSSILARVCLHYVKETAINFEKIPLLVFTLSKSILIYYSARSQLSAWVTPTVDFRVWDRSGFYNRGYFGSLSVVVWVTAKFWGKEDKEKFNFKDFTVKKKKMFCPESIWKIKTVCVCFRVRGGLNIKASPYCYLLTHYYLSILNHQIS